MLNEHNLQGSPSAGKKHWPCGDLMHPSAHPFLPDQQRAELFL